MPSDTIVNLLKYGNWSGPGWSASKLASEFEAQGVARVITPVDRSIPGIDAYDNYVSKVHDLNEFDAEDQLRLALAELGLVNNAQGDLNGMPVYLEPLVFGGQERGDQRLVSYHSYQQKLHSDGASRSDEEKFATAFAKYYRHIIKSNAQFAIDEIMNRFNAGVPGPRQLSMKAQLMAAPHIFIEEANDIVELLHTRIGQVYGSDLVPDDKLAAYFDTHFLTPDGPDMANAPVPDFTPVLNRSAMLATPFRKLRLLRGELREAHDDSRMKLQELIDDQRSTGGFELYFECLDAVQRVERPQDEGP